MEIIRSCTDIHIDTDFDLLNTHGKLFVNKDGIAFKMLKPRDFFCYFMQGENIVGIFRDKNMAQEFITAHDLNPRLYNPIYRFIKI